MKNPLYIFSFLISFFLGSPSLTFAQGLEVEQAVPEDFVEPERQYDHIVDDLVADCKKCSENDKSRECAYCDGIITGASTVLGMLEFGKSFCPPGNIDTNMARNAFRRWDLDKEKKDPSVMQLQAIQGLVMGLQESFPCNKNTGTQ